MKKFVALILILLPVFLLVAISIAGVVLSRIVIIYVDSVAFVNEAGEEIATLSIELGEEHTLMHRIYPVQATNKKVSYNSSKSDNVSVDNGEIKGLKLGRSIITIITEDGKKTTAITIEVVPGPIASVEINYYDNVEFQKDFSTPLAVIVKPDGLVGVRLYWESSDTGIATVDSNGFLTTIAVGEVTITVTVKTEDETRSVSAERIIKVIDTRAPLYLINGSSFESPVNMVDLKLYFGYDEALATFEDIHFEVKAANSGIAELVGEVLTINQQNQPVKVTATLVLDKQYYVEMYFIWNNG